MNGIFNPSDLDNDPNQDLAPLQVGSGNPGQRGEAGAPGQDGVDGKNAYTTTTAEFLVTAISTVSINDPIPLLHSYVTIGGYAFYVIGQADKTLTVIGAGGTIEDSTIISAGSLLYPIAAPNIYKTLVDESGSVILDLTTRVVVSVNGGSVTVPVPQNCYEGQLLVIKAAGEGAVYVYGVLPAPDRITIAPGACKWYIVAGGSWELC